MIKRNHRLLNALNLILDGMLIALSYWTALWLRFDVLKGRQSMQIDSPRAVAAVLLCSVFLVLAYYATGLYGGGRLRRKREEGLYIILINGLGTLTFMAVCYVVRMVDFSRLVLVLFWVISSLTVVSKHLAVYAILSYYRAKGYNLKHVIIIGSGQLAHQYAQDIRNNPQLGYSMLGYIGDVCQRALGKRLGSYAQIGQILGEKNPDEVVLALDPQDVSIIPDAIAAADKEGVRLSLVPIFNDYIPQNPTIVSLGRTKLIDIRETLLDDLFWAAIKRTMDIVGSLVLILVFSPVMIAVAIGVKLSGPGPVLFCQERMGKNKKHFKMLKFRSMHSTGTENTGWSTSGDPRKTRFGRFIRKFSLDELPQFFNVLKGDMSLVGPRPEMPFHVRHFKEEVPLYLLRQQVRPGITGWAQVNGLRGDTSIQERVRYDLWYIENWSIGLDMKILLKTALGGMVNKESVKL
ncbi:MAG: undecaprenyl-phosphate glucose phosphotransferase [Clostridia bacterium]|nr:undecaprenyl-phosphate glucose phosphotransferase [Clostridia bacterium]